MLDPELPVAGEPSADMESAGFNSVDQETADREHILVISTVHDALLGFLVRQQFGRVAPHLEL